MIKNKVDKTLRQKLFIFIMFLFLLLTILWIININKNNKDDANSSDINISDTANTNNDDSPRTQEDEGQPTPSKTVSIPAIFSIEVPFTSQAPIYNWDTLHENACEEASLIMLYYWINNKAFASPEEAEIEILKLSEYEKNTGYEFSISLNELKTIAEKHFLIKNLTLKTIDNSQQIKEIIASGSPVIVGAAGKILPNPNFKNGGPNYHMLLIKGYDTNGFITNDPGTRKGENFYYKNDELYNAIHDWDPNNILNGQKNIMYLKLDS